ncbi:hypothetical protein Rhopal_002946-T1 [Rhodotorula paludigena]|uniref:Uncharacterized protein n=1 Tax=Rhodotorula paludigena TaxID=86838 RepID=A0AAV5GKG5_9BASI|nr:hypothetical protein Rhopal_002946-T1 [Rhodotorula paludigena]
MQHPPTDLQDPHVTRFDMARGNARDEEEREAIEHITLHTSSEATTEEEDVAPAPTQHHAHHDDDLACFNCYAAFSNPPPGRRSAWFYAGREGRRVSGRPVVGFAKQDGSPFDEPSGGGCGVGRRAKDNPHDGGFLVGRCCLVEPSGGLTRRVDTRQGNRVVVEGACGVDVEPSVPCSSAALVRCSPSGPFYRRSSLASHFDPTDAPRSPSPPPVGSRARFTPHPPGVQPPPSGPSGGASSSSRVPGRARSVIHTDVGPSTTRTTLLTPAEASAWRLRHRQEALGDGVPGRKGKAPLGSASSSGVKFKVVRRTTTTTTVQTVEEEEDDEDEEEEKDEEEEEGHASTPPSDGKGGSGGGGRDGGGAGGGGAASLVEAAAVGSRDA